MVKLNKKIFVALFVCAVFIAGFTLAEPISAASWKKFDSGKITVDSSSSVKYIGYKKNSKNYKMVVYYKYNGIGTIKAVTVSFTKKTSKKITLTTKNYMNGNKESKTYKTSKSVKTIYKSFKKGFIKGIKSTT
ncbi:MAG: hypothetical protein LBR24_01065 [Methanobrevibacter sp.]|jgi:hypothetical protein|nr:hypothetical protein [Methanobrevibacter sp.]